MLGENILRIHQLAQNSSRIYWHTRRKLVLLLSTNIAEHQLNHIPGAEKNRYKEPVLEKECIWQQAVLYLHISIPLWYLAGQLENWG
jgi:hypothetical protein